MDDAYMVCPLLVAGFSNVLSNSIMSGNVMVYWNDDTMLRLACQ